MDIKPHQVVITAVVIALLTLLIGHMIVRSGLQDMARKALAQQHAIEDTVLGFDARATFVRSELANVSIASLIDHPSMSYQRQDLNKSRIAGQYVGSRVKEFVTGFWKGNKEKGKHEE